MQLCPLLYTLRDLETCSQSMNFYLSGVLSEKKTFNGLNSGGEGGGIECFKK